MGVYHGISSNGMFVTADNYGLQDLDGKSLSSQPSTDKWNIVIDNIVYRLNIDLNTKESD